MKNIICLILTAVMMLSFMAPAAMAQNEICVEVNGQKIEFDVAPFIENGRTMVPIRGIFEALGGEVLWIKESETVVINMEEDTVSCVVDSYEITKNYSLFRSDVPAKNVNGRVFVPVRVISELFGLEVLWMGDSNTVCINSAEYPFEVTYIKEEMTRKTRSGNATVTAVYSYPQITDGKGFLSGDVVERANEVAKEIAYDMFNLNEYAFYVESVFPVFAEEKLYGYPEMKIEVETYIFASEKFGTVSFQSCVNMPWTGNEMVTKTFDKDEFDQAYTIGSALGLSSSIEGDSINQEIYNEFTNCFDYVRYGREEFDKHPLENVYFVLEGDRVYVFASNILLTGVGRVNGYYSVVKSY